jgi:phosphate transport system substrate-binding protein
MKKCIGLILAVIMVTVLFASCSGGGGNGGEIVVVSREDGSGTRGAFTELLGIEEKDAEGNRTDLTTEEAAVVNSTSVVMITIAGNPDAIGYISLGSLNDMVKALKVDGAEASAENIKSNTYMVYRPFNIATKSEVSEAAQDFINFILSSDGQKVVEENGYIAASEEGAYQGTKATGKTVVAGSSSVTPVMEKLKEAYQKINPNVEIEIQQSDSSNGMLSAIEGTCDIGMASRELKESELAELEAIAIALDGIAVVVNKENPMEDITSEQIKEIFKGEITNWGELSN